MNGKNASKRSLTGVELDKETFQEKEVPGNFLHADFTQFYKYLRARSIEADIFALNPPSDKLGRFGKTFEELSRANDAWLMNSVTTI